MVKFSRDISVVQLTVSGAFDGEGVQDLRLGWPFESVRALLSPRRKRSSRTAAFRATTNKCCPLSVSHM